MTTSDVLKTALEAADEPIMLDRAVDVQRAAKAWRRSDVLGLDTEFVRERTYYANLGLVQISDGRTVWLVDPLVPGVLEPVHEMLADRSTTKLFHSPSEDLEVLLHAAGALPDPMIDTQAACALLGQPLQMGYHTAVEWLLDVNLKKEQTRSNWCARPLTAAQVHYASLDVCLLPQMWRMLAERLDRRGRTDWLHEDCRFQLAKAGSSVSAEDLWQKIRGTGRLDGSSLAVLQALARWREKEAREKNRPRGFIVKDAVLVAIAERKIREPEDLSGLDDLHPKARLRYGETLCHMVNETLASGREIPPLDRLSNQQKKALDLLRKRTHDRAASLDLEPTVLATKNELEQLVRSHPDPDIPERLGGWRYEVLTRELMTVLEGCLS